MCPNSAKAEKALALEQDYSAWASPKEEMLGTLLVVSDGIKYQPMFIR